MDRFSVDATELIAFITSPRTERSFPIAVFFSCLEKENELSADFGSFEAECFFEIQSSRTGPRKIFDLLLFFVIRNKIKDCLLREVVLENLIAEKQFHKETRGQNSTTLPSTLNH